jgi:5-methylcytosine-specific restriction endonuclease McrBC regulatory subunit McrC
MDTQSAPAAEGSFLFDLLARWLVRSVESVLRRDLLKDYRAHRDELPHVRGRISVKETTLALTRGLPRITCEFDELDRDNPLNRVLLAGLRTVTSAPFASPDIRKQARRASARFEDVSPLQHGDLRVDITPRTAYYADSLAVARALLRGAARSLDTGGEVAWAFLIRTPEAVEAGVRMILQAGLSPDFTVEKRGLTLLPSTKTLNPDLVFGDRAVADVKYKLQGQDWDTGDLYQAIAFATGFRVQQAAIVTFSKGQPAHQSLQVGDVTLSSICWPASPLLDARAAAAHLTADVRQWLEMGDA